MALPSTPAVMILVPSGVTATARTGPGWPTNGGSARCFGTIMNSSVPVLIAVAQYDSRTSLHSQSSAHPLSSGDSTT